MSEHPALQPVLRETNVIQLMGRLAGEAERAACDGDAEHLDYFDGLRFAQEALQQMWHANIIAADAVARDLDIARDVDAEGNQL